MTHRILTILATIAIAGFSGITAAQADVVHPAPLTTHVSAHGTKLEIIGFSANNGVIFNDRSNGNVYAVKPDGTNLHVVIHAGRAYAVAGGLIEYEDLTSPGVVDRYLDLDSLADGLVPDSWEAITVGGGVRTQHQTDGWHLYYEPDIGGAEQDFGAMNDLPNDASLEVSVTASDHGMLVVGTPASSDPPSTEFFATPDAPAHYALDTTGVTSDDGMFCLHVNTAIGCEGGGFTADKVIGLDPSGATAPAISTVSGNLGDVVFARGTTHSHAYTTYDVLDDFDVFCPCRVHFTNGTVITGLDTPTIVSDDATHAHVYYVKGGNGHDTGIYRSQFGHGAPQLVARAPRAPLDAIVPSLGPGRAVWSDDSTSSGGTWVRGVSLHSGAPSLGARQRVIGEQTTSFLASGTRTAYLDQHGVHVRSATHLVTIPHSTYLFGLSGFRVLYLAGPGPGHISVYNLRDGSSWDATSHLHLAVPYTTPLLDGNYLTYFRPNGSVWRKNLASSHAPAQLGAPISHFAIGTIFGSGNWVSWTAFHDTGSDSVDRFRNVHAGAITHAVTAPWRIAAASAAGFAVTHEDATGDHYELRSWTDGSTITTLPPGGGDAVSGENPPSLNGQFVGYLGNAGRPTVAVLPEHVVNRPYALGSAAADGTVQRNHTWLFDLVTSAPLTSCSIVITRSGHAVRHLACDGAAMKAGEVRSSWHATNARHRYKWQVVAHNADGSLLQSDSTTGPVAGHVRIT
jgi:hypothetical protein